MKSFIAVLKSLVLFLALSLSASATVIQVGIGAFGPDSTLTTFNAQVDGTEVNEVTVDGIHFQYSLGNGSLIFDGGPGVTNSIDPLNIVSIGNPAGTLTLTLPSAMDTFGYGFAILNLDAVANATTIALFDGATSIGSMSYSGVPDPMFTGGFAGIQSTIPFNRVELTFNSVVAPAFALDNVRMASAAAAVPEPVSLTTWILLSSTLFFSGRQRKTALT